MENGLRCSGSVPFGYYRKEGDKQTLYVDEKAVNVVHRIYKMFADGSNLKEIASVFYEEKILNPSAYSKKYRPENNRSRDIKAPYFRIQIHLEISLKSENI